MKSEHCMFSNVNIAIKTQALINPKHRSVLSINVKTRIYKTVILPVILWGCENWSLALRKKHRPRVFENRVLRRIFGQKEDEVIGGSRKQHNEELHNLYGLPSIIRMIQSRKMRGAGHVACMGEKRNWILMGKLEGKRPLGRPRRMWKDNIRMDLRDIGWGCMDWIELAQDRDQWRALVNTVMNLRVP
jgi:hypothetical protein